MARAISLLRPVSLSLTGMLRRLDQAQRLHRQRQALARLDAATLRDIGVSAEEALAESARSPWDAPRHWRG